MVPFSSLTTSITSMLTSIAPAIVAATIALPGGPPVAMDYLAIDRVNDRLWVPSGNTGAINVIDLPAGKVRTLTGLPTRPASHGGRPNRGMMGPSSVAIGRDTVWVGNRGDDALCAFDARTLARGACVKLASMPDGLAFVAGTGELWATTPRDGTLTIVGTRGGFAAPVTLRLDGEPEGYAVDEGRGRFYTNLEDKDRTVAVDVKTRKVVASWPTGCGAEGPRGLVLDDKRQLLFSACTSGAVAMDVAHGGAAVGRIETGGGVDNLDYDAARGLLFVASPRDGTLTVARVGKTGTLTAVAVVPTAKGARNPVVDARGTAYVADSPAGRIIVVPLPAGAR